MHTSSNFNETGQCTDCLYAENVDPILVKYQSQIKSFGFETDGLRETEYNPTDIWNVKSVFDASTLYLKWYNDIRGFSPG